MIRERTVHLIVRYIGAIAVLTAVGSMVLFVLILLASKGKDTVDVQVVAMYGGITAMAASSVTLLGGMLISTSSKPDEDSAPLPVQVVNEGPDEAVPVEPGE